MEIIRSKENKKVKLLAGLSKASKRRKEGLILIEGQKEIIQARRAKLEIVEIFVCPDFCDENIIQAPITGLSKEIFKSLSYRENPDGVLAIAKRPEGKLSQFEPKQNALVLVLESVEKPGNIGAMLRTADAVGADALILCDPQTDLYNPNVIRASLGAIFTVPAFVASNEEALAWLKNRNFKIYSASLLSSKDFRKVSYKGASAIIIGTEHEGLSPFWTDNSTANIKIPMNGRIDSLNASVSAAVILYEAERQRMVKDMKNQA